MRKIFASCLFVLTAGCTSLKVTTANGLGDYDICVIKNESIKDDFTSAYVRQIENNGYKIKMVDQAESLSCLITATYSATYGFHWGVYLATANLKVFKGKKLVGEAYYKAPFASPAKHGRVENKINAMVNKLLPQL